MECCPICHTQLIQGERGYAGDSVLAEDEQTCPKGCYYYLFTYGATQVEISGFQWMWHYDSPADTRRVQNSEMQAVIEGNRLPTADERFESLTFLDRIPDYA
jgi:hypothetical protein